MLLIAGCGGKSEDKLPPGQAHTEEAVPWPHADDGLVLEIRASKDLNLFEGKPHTALLCVYQLEKQDAFKTLVDQEGGISRLLQCSAFDPTVKMTTRIFLQPGESAVHTLDRAEGARFVAVVAGYFSPSAGRRFGLWHMAVDQETSGIFWKTTVYSAGVTRLHLHLDAQNVGRDAAPAK